MDNFNQMPFCVTEDCTPILGRSSCKTCSDKKTLNALTVEYKVTKENLLDKFCDLFSGLGKLPVKYQIEINKKNIRQNQ